MSVSVGVFPEPQFQLPRLIGALQLQHPFHSRKTAGGELVLHSCPELRESFRPARIVFLLAWLRAIGSYSPASYGLQTPEERSMVDSPVIFSSREAAHRREFRESLLKNAEYRRRGGGESRI
jgi:hypothetical protein